MLELTETVRRGWNVNQGQTPLRQLCKPRSVILRRCWCANITDFRLVKHGRNTILRGFKHLNRILLMKFHLQFTTIACSSCHPVGSKLQKKLKLHVAICSFSYRCRNVLFSWWGLAKRRSVFYLPSLFSNVMPLPKPNWNLTTKPDDLLLISQVWTSLTLTLSLRWAYV